MRPEPRETGQGLTADPACPINPTVDVMIDRKTAGRVHHQELEEAAAMFKALADPARLQTLIILAENERNVGDLAEIEGDKTGTVSARLKVLLQARLVRRRRDGKSVIYSIADNHILNLIENAVEHASEHH
jgi:DNA-binding transcriptional ArsR family regulator